MRETNPLTALLQTSLDRRDSSGLLRSLRITDPTASDFSSNDYLGLARCSNLHNRFLSALSSLHQPLHGSTGSRLLSGNSPTAIQLEHHLAAFHRSETALLFNSGYDANLSLFATLPHPGSVVLYDELAHASVHDGLKQCRAGVVVRSWKHNDLGVLEKLVWEHVVRIESLFAGKEFMPGIIVMVESIYSMDGDVAPIREIVQLAQRVGNRGGGLHLIVDEAHSTGVCGENGRGLVCELGLESHAFARLHTFGKAVGSHGAVVLGSSTLRNFLINYARPLVYSTSLPVHSLISIKCAYDQMSKDASELQSKLHQIIHHFRHQLKTMPPGIEAIDSHTAIQAIIVPGNKECSRVCTRLQSKGYDVRPIRSPTVAKGAERLRICLHAHNTMEEVTGLLRLLDFDESSNEISSQTFPHPNPITFIAPSPDRTDFVFTCHHDATPTPNPRASLYLLSALVEDSDQKLTNQTGQLSELLCIESCEKVRGVNRVLWDPSGGKTHVIATGKDSVGVYAVDRGWSQGTLESVISLSTLSKDVSFTSETDITCAKWNPHSPEEVSIGFGSTLFGLDTRSQTPTFTIPHAHHSSIRDLDYNPNKPYHLLTAGDDGLVRIWDTRHVSKPVKELANHHHWVWSAGFNRFHDQLVLSGGGDCCVCLNNVVSVSSTPYGLIRSLEEGMDAGQEFKDPIKTTDELIATYREFEDSVYTVAWSSADPWIFASVSFDGRVSINMVPKEVKYSIIL
ncbi:hypothetical protein HDU98_006311 [Podochytrium sp. JEL0797]|nr:hypothetical protein HDU98_006311 [Podochytrium sp. JEL0797]